MYRKISIVLVLVLLGAMIPGMVRPAQANGTGWFGEYYNNLYLAGSPVVARFDDALSFNWGYGAPAPGVSADNFTVRWGANPYFEGGLYQFQIVADDSVRVTVDFNSVLVDTLEAPRPGEAMTADITLSRGTHHIQVDYREHTQTAYLHMTWSKIGGSSSPVYPAHVSAYELNLRTGPGTHHSRIMKLAQNTGLHLLGRNADASWVQVRTASGTTGWVAARYVSTSVQIVTLPITSNEPQPAPSPISGVLAQVGTGALNARSGPGVTYSVITSLLRGQQVGMIGRNAETSWVQVVLPDGRQAWMRASYLDTTASIVALPVTYGTYFTHIVQRGETLFRIALRYGADMYTIAAINGIADVRRIYAGQVLRIPV